MDTTGKLVEDDRYVQNAVKRTRATWRKIVWKKLDVQTADKIIRVTQDLAMFTKKKMKYLRWNIRAMCSSWKQEKLLGTYMGENNNAFVARRADTTNQDNKYRILVEKWIQLEANDWPKFQEHLKKLHSNEFYQAPAQQQVRNGERSNVIVQGKTQVGSITLTRTSSNSAKQPLHKSPIRPSKSIKDRQKKTCLS